MSDTTVGDGSARDLIPDTNTGSMFDEGPNLAAASGTRPYRVLARKYRPSTFDDLIGQDAMVLTLSNAFDSGRIPQAWILTGVRGVGKTTTARILARGLNYLLPDGSGGPTIHMPVEGVHCRAIMESRHVDVMEMDAASHTGIDDVKQLTDGVRYAPASARYKVYIIDEVHMLSDKAFNAFLKTLEEPPPHAKFVFATTEIRKVPVTILSRCQRFDLRRVEAGVLVNHLRKICSTEAVTIDDEALALVARAAEGSVRDSLSLLDQAIAHGAGHVDAETVRTMLGLADRARVIDLFECIMKGDIATALAEFKTQYDLGADPRTIISDLAEFTHFVTRMKIVPDTARDSGVTEVERTRGAAFTSLPMRVLSRAWQMLLKGLVEIGEAPKPATAAEMLLIRLAYAADLPTPDDAIKQLLQNGAASSQAPTTGPDTGGGRTRMSGGGAALSIASRAEPGPRPEPSSAPQANAMIRIERFEDLVALAAEKRDIALKTALERDVRLVRFEDGKIEFATEANASPRLAAELGQKLHEWTGRRWVIAVASTGGEKSLREQANDAHASKLDDVRVHPVIEAAFRHFPGAEIIGIHDVTATENEADDGGEDLFDFTALDFDPD